MKIGNHGEEIWETPKLPRGVIVVDCESIEFVGKDVIVLKNWDDFLFILTPQLLIYRMKNVYYNISDSVAYVYKEND